ncbi:hypothetical protein SPHINGOR109_70080 [Sphingorhabdus sp. 109]|nr:hypothetical protein SPHINGOR109_70080 [Sphingorhabdus sp. 109]
MSIVSVISEYNVNKENLLRFFLMTGTQARSDLSGDAGHQSGA